MILLFSFCGCNNDLPVLVKTVVWLMCQETATTQVCSITPSSWKFRYFQSKLFHPLSRLFSSRVSVGGAAPWASDRGRYRGEARAPVTMMEASYPLPVLQQMTFAFQNEYGLYLLLAALGAGFILSFAVGANDSANSWGIIKLLMIYI